MQIILRLILIPIICSLLTCNVARSEDTTSDENPKSAQGKKYSSSFVSFRKFDDLMKDICEEWKADGRLNEIYPELLAAAKKESPCKPCRSFARAFEVACNRIVAVDAEAAKPKKTSKKKKEKEGEEPAETPTPAPSPTKAPIMQSLPSTAVLDLISRLAVGLEAFGQDDDRVIEATKFLIDLFLGIGAKDGKPQQYFDIMCAYLGAPWNDEMPEDAPEEAIEAQKKKNAPKKEEEWQDFF